MATNFEQLAITRFCSFVGAGFVVGIRLISGGSRQEVGLAEGVYGGWGNFGAFASYVALPSLALWFGGENGWRWAIASTGALAFVYGLVFLWRARNTPAGASYFKPKKATALEVSNRRDLFFYVGACLPLYIALGVIVWRLGPQGFDLYGEATQWMMASLVLALAVIQLSQVWKVNRERMLEPAPKHDRAPSNRWPFSTCLLHHLWRRAGSEIHAFSVLSRHLCRSDSGDRWPASLRLCVHQPDCPPRWQLAVETVSAARKH